MRLSYAFTASAAEFSPDSRLYVLGGDFDTIQSPDFPFVMPTFALVVKLSIQPLECQRPHRLRVALIDSDGRPVNQEITIDFGVQPNPEFPHRNIGMGFAIQFSNTSFTDPGDYAFHMLVDDIELGVVPVHLAERGTPMAPETGGDHG